MRLNLESIKNTAAWQAAGIALPSFDISAMREETAKAPVMLHFGAGNIFRAFPAAAVSRLLDAGLCRAGVIACEAFDGEIIDKAYTPFDNLSLLCLLSEDGTVDCRVIASVASALRIDGTKKEDTIALLDILASPSLQMVSFTITEKGYAVRGADGSLLSWIAQDIACTPDAARSTLGLLCAGLLRRFRAGKTPLALVSMDNCSHNGDKLRDGVLAIAEGYRDNGFAEQAFVDWLRDPRNVSFPLTMIDKITPRPDEKVAEILREKGFEDTEIIVTAKNTYTAAFINAEETEYLVIEDLFPNGRPPLEKAGFIMTDRDTVDRVERMKVTTCLNPLHTALAVLGCLLGFERIHREMRDADLTLLVRYLAFREGMPVVTDPGVISPMEFAQEVVKKRFSNPFMPDTPQRIATDTSQKLPVRFGETVKAYMASDTLSTKSLRCLPFVYASWLRYLLCVDDKLVPFTPSPDPKLEEMRALLKNVKFGKNVDNTAILTPILYRRDLFGVDLFDAGLAPVVIKHFNDMVRGKDAVRYALRVLLDNEARLWSTRK